MDALAGVRIIDFGWAMVGPWSARFLALMGAEVIKVETRKRLCVLRRYVPLPGGTGIRSFAPGERPPEDMPTDTMTSNDTHLNKLGVTLDLTTPEGSELARRLVGIADAVVENFRPGVMERHGLSYQHLKEVKPDIVMLSSSYAGSSGPESGYVGYADTFAALGGLAHLTGYPDRPASEIRFPMDPLNATTGAVALMIALIHRQHTGEGQWIDLSASEGPTSLVAESIMDYTMNQREQTREGNLDESMAPHNCYRCLGEDKWVSIVVAEENEWETLCNAMGNPEWAKDRRVDTGYERWQNQEELDRLIQSWTIEHTSYEVMHTLQQVGVAAFPSLSANEIWADPHLEARSWSEIVDHPALGAQMVIKPPWKLSETPVRIKRHGPMLGQDNEYVFGELLGLSSADISQLVEREVIC